MSKNILRQSYESGEGWARDSLHLTKEENVLQNVKAGPQNWRTLVNTVMNFWVP
jgi:hypothetical protein